MLSKGRCRTNASLLIFLVIQSSFVQCLEETRGSADSVQLLLLWCRWEFTERTAYAQLHQGAAEQRAEHTEYLGMNILGWTSQPWPMSWMKDKDWKKPSPVSCLVDNKMFSVARTVRHTTDCLTRLCSLQRWMSLRVDETNSYQEWLRCNYPCPEAGGCTGWVLPALFLCICDKNLQSWGPSPELLSPLSAGASARSSILYKILPDCSHHPNTVGECVTAHLTPSHTLSDTVTRGENIKQKMRMGYSHYVNVTNTLKVTATWKGYTDLATKDGFTRLIQL